MNIFRALAVLVILALSSCADFESEDHSNGMSAADAYIGNVRPGSENESKFNHGIGAMPTY